MQLSPQSLITSDNFKVNVDLSTRSNKIPTSTRNKNNNSEVAIGKKQHFIENTHPLIASKHRTNDYDEKSQENSSENRIREMSSMNVVSTRKVYTMKTAGAAAASASASGKLTQTQMNQENFEKQKFQNGNQDENVNENCCEGVGEFDDDDNQKQQQQHHHDSEENLLERENIRLVSLGPYSHLDSNYTRTPPTKRKSCSSSSYYIKPLPPRTPPKPRNFSENYSNSETARFPNDSESISGQEYDPVVFREKIENFERNFSAHSYDGSGSNNGFNNIFNNTNSSSSSNIIIKNTNNNYKNKNLNFSSVVLVEKSPVINIFHKKSGSLPLVSSTNDQSGRILRYDSFGRRKNVIGAGIERGINSANVKNIEKDKSLSAKELNSSMLINDIDDRNIYSLSEENIYNNNDIHKINNNNNCYNIDRNNVVEKCKCEVNSHKSLEGLRVPETAEAEVSFLYFLLNKLFYKQFFFN